MEVSKSGSWLSIDRQSVQFIYPVGHFVYTENRVFVCLEHPAGVVLPDNLLCWNTQMAKIEWRINPDIYILPSGRKSCETDRIVDLRLELASRELLVFPWDGPTLCLCVDTLELKWREGKRWGIIRE